MESTLFITWFYFLLKFTQKKLENSLIIVRRVSGSPFTSLHFEAHKLNITLTHRFAFAILKQNKDVEALSNSFFL